MRVDKKHEKTVLLSMCNLIVLAQQIEASLGSTYALHHYYMTKKDDAVLDLLEQAEDSMRGANAAIQKLRKLVEEDEE